MPTVANKTDKESNVLTKIVDTKVAHIASLKLRYPEANLQPKISDRSLFDALKAPNAGYIFECKKASPSKGLIRPVFDVEAIANIYGKYAAGISVLTDEQFFHGDIDYIPLVRARVSQPILCKDFFVDPYQIKLAAHQGADAVLLMLSVLDDEQYKLLAEEAAKYNLDALTEVSNQEELERAIDLNARIVGINNRNLRDLSTDLATTEALAPQIPTDRVIISESGIYNNQQVKRLNPLVDGYLVGSSIMAQEDIDLACRQLIFGNNKVCGLTRLEDIKAVTQAGAVFGGLIFHPKSPRNVTVEQAASLVEQSRQALTESEAKTGLNFVGVFVNKPNPEIVATVKAVGLAVVQLHGSENSEDISELKQLLAEAELDCQIWKAVSVDTAADTNTVSDNNVGDKPEGCDRYLFDSKNTTGFGGTGETFNWQALFDNSAITNAERENSMLAGGLTPENALDANQQGFYGLDLNSGVESEPGIKDAQKIAQAFAAIRKN
ncbi:bifunctional indole-3-glycerol-phosphate synthase TrpC/phosphoribosylanthranilate isomerase TrpF [Shewanella olleyana]|uniref:bifunctional indole-3-glycerol-phosphate synthase TrpC/phosphoribosylanthranilate isomerase TrpF n=1 Tax=Shewanella olleyana TaxID=135626 RepID=UPI00200CC54F|nr:bifunctional indole-3-glycerol-phosphate synthase TrpC/phosphoribosylanthranilate isomerase TrpF [Shewanella olleyana]MCL1065259.1 bifunctional indole-3-glycerol-phosphate synthase TrpC/phosphoribosylanthranilate isomerase TrpF [Shewanella olleyana]